MSPTITPSDDDRVRLERLRRGFLAQPPRSEWRERRDLVLYEATFAQRIAWKWSALLDELAARGFAAPEGEIVDLGCGSAIASRSWLRRFGNARGATLRLVDAWPPALEYARQHVRAEFPAQSVEFGLGSTPPGLLLVSHVLGELDDAQRDELVALARSAASVVWLEPGERSTSRALGAVRDELRDAFEIVAPCTHAELCPLLQPGREADWCHFFARPPQEVFTDSSWAHFGKDFGIDLRSLPYSCLVLRRAASTPNAAAASDGTSLERVLGRPRMQKGRVLLDVCGVAGCRRLSLLERDAGDEYERLDDPAGECLRYSMEIDEKRIRKLRREP